MQDNLADLTAAPRTLKIGGASYAVHPLTLADFGRLQEWVDGQWPDPFDAVNRQVATGRYNTAQQQFMIRTALELSAKRRPLGTPEADEMLQSVAGVLELLYVSISKGDPAFTRETAAGLHKLMTFADIARVFQATNADLVLGDPKAETATTTGA